MNNTRVHKFFAIVLFITIAGINSCSNNSGTHPEKTSGRLKTIPADITETPDEHGPAITLFWLTSDEHTSYRLITFDLQAESDKAITAWHISEEPRRPSPDDRGWKEVKPESYLLSLSEGLKNVYARAKDADNNISPAAALTVLLDRTQPEILAFDIKGSRSETDPQITLDILAGEDITELSWYIGEELEPPDRPSSLWETECPKSYLISQMDGHKTVNLWAMDRAGNISDKKSLSVYYKTKKCRITWEPNREHGVNSPGGGYEVFFSRDSECDPERAFKKVVHYRKKYGTPNETVLGLGSGTWYIRVRGFSALRGKTTGGLSDTISIRVTD